MTDKLTPLQYAEAVEAAFLAEGIEANLGAYLNADVSIEAVPSEEEEGVVEYLALVVDEVELFRTGGETPTEAVKEIEKWVLDHLLIDINSDLIASIVTSTTPAEA
tara:strand:- start:4362 stop:4679 length:318 start_codon:yes stop_codon:yes gene_type:complete